MTPIFIKILNFQNKLGLMVIFFYRCPNHKCILKSRVCDGENNCGDNADEDPMICK